MAHFCDVTISRTRSDGYPARAHTGQGRNSKSNVTAASVNRVRSTRVRPKIGASGDRRLAITCNGRASTMAIGIEVAEPVSGIATIVTAVPAGDQPESG